MSVVCAAEFLYAPQISAWHSAGIFPSVPVGVRLSVGETLVGSFIVIVGGYLLLKRGFQDRHIYVAPPGFKMLTGLFLLSVLLSLGIGFVLRSPSFIKEIREFIIPGSLVFVFLNLTISKKTEDRVLQVFYWMGVVSLMIGGILFVIPSIVPGGMFMLPEGGFWPVLYSGIFTGTWSAARLLWKGYVWRDSLILLAALGIFLLWISHKPILFTFFVSLSALILAALFSKRSVVVSRARNLAVALPSMLVVTFLLTPKSVLENFVRVFAWRYLKLRNITSFQELQSALGEAGNRDQDLSAGRFEIWADYFRDAASGLGLAPDGLGGAAEVTTYLQGYVPGFPAHNTVAYMSYHVGYVAAISYVAIVVLYLYQGFRYLPRQPRREEGHKEVKLVAIFAFTVGIIAVGLVGGPLKDYRLAWFFWFGVAVLARRWSWLTAP
jgi:hypothetical protein